jgi:hypothetical protein
VWADEAWLSPESGNPMSPLLIVDIKNFADGHKPPDRVIPAML